MLKSVLRFAVNSVLPVLGPQAREQWKRVEEERYWRKELRDGRSADQHRAHFEQFFTTFWGMPVSHYDGKTILDVGCGPAGSLEWANAAKLRVGLDTLAEVYGKINGGNQAMYYVTAPAERIPYPDRFFDIVSTFNSLDHVEDIDRAIGEIKRVAGQEILLIVEIGHEPTPTEPHRLDAKLYQRFAPEFRPQGGEVRCFAVRPDHNIYKSCWDAAPYPGEGEGVLCVRMVRTAGAN